jgi:hypothetical protein
VEFEYVSTRSMAADMLTKAVTPEQFRMCCRMIGVG